MFFIHHIYSSSPNWLNFYQLFSFYFWYLGSLYFQLSKKLENLSYLSAFYNNICYDKIRKVTVLPSNLRKFDCYVIVFSAGYYNMLFHDIDNQNPDNLDNKVLPTKRKLSDEIFNFNVFWIE